MAAKQDFLGECNTQKVTIEDFQQQFCVRCINPECSRSKAGDSKFERRVSSWEDWLFNQTPKMNPQDPRYEEIRSKRFMVIGEPLEVHGSSWVDPRDLSEGKESGPAVIEPAPSPTHPEPMEPAPEPTPKLKSPGLVNTPTSPKRMIGAPVTPAADPKVTPDPWAPKQKTEGEKIVGPGARVRFGSGVTRS
jgi:hypothetical protein